MKKTYTTRLKSDADRLEALNPDSSMEDYAFALGYVIADLRDIAKELEQKNCYACGRMKHDCPKHPEESK